MEVAELHQGYNRSEDQSEEYGDDGKFYRHPYTGPECALILDKKLQYIGKNLT